MFSGNQYARYDTTTETGDEGYPRILSSDSFPGLSFSQIDAAVDWGNGKVSEWEKRKKNAKYIYIYTTYILTYSNIHNSIYRFTFSTKISMSDMMFF